MEFASNITTAALFQQILVGLSRTTILFIVSSGLSLVLGVLRIPNVAHGSLYMIGAFLTYTIADGAGRLARGFLAGPDPGPARGGPDQFRRGAGPVSAACTSGSI